MDVESSMEIESSMELERPGEEVAKETGPAEVADTSADLGLLE